MSAARKEYAIEVYGRPRATWLALPSDEDDGRALHVTTDPAMAERFRRSTVAQAMCRIMAGRYPQHAFRVDALAPLPFPATTTTESRIDG